MRRKILIICGITALILIAAVVWFLLFGQKYRIYQAQDFEIKYPNWPDVEKRNILEPEKTKLAVVNKGCNFVINITAIPASTTFKEYTEKLVQEQIAKTKGKIITQDIQDKVAYFEGEIPIGNTTLHSVSYGYMTSLRQSYGIGFIAPKSTFETVCRPIISEVVKSVKVR